jgi:MoaA/NifB/PqqE/SkfB family radical SAM enzyme
MKTSGHITLWRKTKDFFLSSFDQPFLVRCYHLLWYIAKMKKLINFAVDVTAHCNLDCKGCSHFSPVAEDEYLDIAVFERDCKNLSRLTKKVWQIALVGGEPLLHPRLPEFFDVARKYFDTRSPLRIITNGILLLKQPDTFWQSCKRNNVEIRVTKYPISINLAGIESLAESWCVPLNYFNSDNRKMYHMVLDKDGMQDPRDSYKRCPNSHGCVSTCRDGKIYPCLVVAFVYRLNRHFGMNFEVTEKDYIDLEKANSMEEIVDFIYKPAPFCRYCNIRAIAYGMDWGISKKNLSEWA